MFYDFYQMQSVIFFTVTKFFDSQMDMRYNRFKINQPICAWSITFIIDRLDQKQ